MELFIAITLLAFIALALYFKANMLQLVGMLSFGWVLVYVTNNDAVLYARSLVPVGGNNIDTVTSLLLGFSPAVLSLLLSKRSAKKPAKQLLALIMAPAVFIIGWLTVLLAVTYDTRAELLDSWVQTQVGNYQVYALWGATIAVILYMSASRTKRSKDDKKK